MRLSLFTLPTMTRGFATASPASSLYGVLAPSVASLPKAPVSNGPTGTGFPSTYEGYRAATVEQQSFWAALATRGSLVRYPLFSLAHKAVLAASTGIIVANVAMILLGQPTWPFLLTLAEAFILFWALPFHGILLASTTLSSQPDTFFEQGGNTRLHYLTHHGLSAVVLLGTVSFVYGVAGWTMIGPWVCTLVLLAYPLTVLHMEQGVTGILLDYVGTTQRPLKEGLIWMVRWILIALLPAAVEGLATQMDWLAFASAGAPVLELLRAL